MDNKIFKVAACISINGMEIMDNQFYVHSPKMPSTETVIRLIKEADALWLVSASESNDTSIEFIHDEAISLWIDSIEELAMQEDEFRKWMEAVKQPYIWLQTHPEFVAEEVDDKMVWNWSGYSIMANNHADMMAAINHIADINDANRFLTLNGMILPVTALPVCFNKVNKNEDQIPLDAYIGNASARTAPINVDGNVLAVVGFVGEFYDALV